MDCEDLTGEQLDELKDQVGRHRRYCQSLLARIEQRGFPYDDELRQRVSRVCDDLHSLWITLHYLSCSGTGRAARRQGSKRRDSRNVYRIQLLIDPNAPFPPLEHLTVVEAETPLEAIAKLARSGQLPAGDHCWARIVLSVNESGGADKVVSIALPREMTSPQPES